MSRKEDSKEDIWTDMDREIKEIINFDLLTNEQWIKALELAVSGYLAPIKYIHEVTGMGLKCSKIYYDLYIYPNTNLKQKVWKSKTLSQDIE